MPHFGEDYDLARWANWSGPDHEDYERDADGKVIWHDTYPGNDDWENIGLITVNLDPSSLSGDYRNLVIDPDRPLDPWGEYDPGNPYWYDIDDLMGEIFNSYGIGY